MRGRRTADAPLLTRRERAALTLALRGESRLVSGTMWAHPLSNVRRKLGCRNTVHLVASLLLPLDSPLRRL